MHGTNRCSEKREGPKVPGAVVKTQRNKVPDGIQIGTAVVVDDAFWSARGARRVIQSNWLPLILHVGQKLPWSSRRSAQNVESPSPSGLRGQHT